MAVAASNKPESWMMLNTLSTQQVDEVMVRARVEGDRGSRWEGGGRSAEWDCGILWGVSEKPKLSSLL